MLTDEEFKQLDAAASAAIYGDDEYATRFLNEMRDTHGDPGDFSVVGVYFALIESGKLPPDGQNDAYGNLQKLIRTCLSIFDTSTPEDEDHYFLTTMMHFMINEVESVTCSDRALAERYNKIQAMDSEISISIRRMDMAGDPRAGTIMREWTNEFNRLAREAESLKRAILFHSVSLLEIFLEAILNRDERLGNHHLMLDNAVELILEPGLLQAQLLANKTNSAAAVVAKYSKTLEDSKRYRRSYTYWFAHPDERKSLESEIAELRGIIEELEPKLEDPSRTYYEEESLVERLRKERDEKVKVKEDEVSRIRQELSNTSRFKLGRKKELQAALDRAETVLNETRWSANGEMKALMEPHLERRDAARLEMKTIEYKIDAAQKKISRIEDKIWNVE